jgi:molybdate transport system substrate-binding protein
MRVRATVAILVIGAAAGGGCGSGAETTATGAEPSGTITVSAASTLTEAFTEIGEHFSSEHDDVEVRFNFGSSASLGRQIVDGAPADVFASADRASMTTLTDEALTASEPTAFARNELIVVTPPGNPAGIAALHDLGDAGVVALCGAEAPCGRLAAEVLANAGVEIPEHRITRGQNVKATLTAVAQGDAVAAIVYASDARAALDSVVPVAIPTDRNVTTTLVIAAVATARNQATAEAFIAHVLGEAGQAILARHGFGAA